MKTRISQLVIFSIFMLIGKLPATAAPGGFENFVTVAGDRLMEGNSELRFISFNIPNLHCIEDYMAFEATNPWRLPDAFEIRDALESVKMMGGTVARIYTITVRRQDDLPDTPRYVLGPKQFNEEAFRTLDQILAIANEVGVRLIIPFVDNWRWMGGRAEYAAFRNKSANDFWSDKKIKTDFKETIEFILKRVNTITGISYRDDKAILAWETGNELQCPDEWTREMIAYIKKLDANHLVIDGYHTNVLRDERLANPQTDIVTTHHYEKDPGEMLAHIRESAEKAKGKKPYLIGEFGFLSTAAMAAIYDFVQQTPNVCGTLLWSLRFRARDGGFYWHSEPGAGGYFYKAYHTPGFESGELYDERNAMALLREHAYGIRGLAMPPLPAPQPPLLLPFDDVSKLTWQGSVGASCYEVERADSLNGPWEAIAWDISETSMAHRPLYNDCSAMIGQSYYYRVRARNRTGVSEPSNTVGPVTVKHLTLVDELTNFGFIFSRNLHVTLQTDNARAFKEEAHRLKGEEGAEIVYYTPLPMLEVRVYLFANSEARALELSASVDGSHFDSLIVDSQNYYAGKADYDYARPMLISASVLPVETRYVKMRFRAEAQIGRVEISYK
ncbi:MAG: hypothetical protein ALAOOOJD_03007 [bacterium]|nr:hypothetical protein [bacterium]